MSEILSRDYLFTPNPPSNKSSHHSRYKSNGGLVNRSIHLTSPLSGIRESLGNHRQNGGAGADLYLPHLKPKQNKQENVRHSMVVQSY